MVSGHLPSQIGNLRDRNPEQLFRAPDNFIKVKKTLEREIRFCQTNFIWTDCDGDQENISLEVFSVY
jgi:DNA topoisomerase-3